MRVDQSNFIAAIDWHESTQERRSDQVPTILFRDILLNSRLKRLVFHVCDELYAVSIPNKRISLVVTII